MKWDWTEGEFELQCSHKCGLHQFHGSSENEMKLEKCLSLR